MDEWDDDELDEDWDEEDDEASEYDETGPCPECGVDLHVDAETCFACGYWLTTADRHKLWDGGSQVRGAMSVGKVVLVVVLIALMSGFLLF